MRVAPQLPNSGCDFLFKMPGVGGQSNIYNRQILKLATIEDLEKSDFNCPIKDAEPIIK